MNSNPFVVFNSDFRTESSVLYFPGFFVSWIPIRNCLGTMHCAPKLYIASTFQTADVWLPHPA